LSNHADQVEFRHADVRDLDALKKAVRRVDVIYHLAAQVAVTTSLLSPLEDFEINARGTLNVLEAIRAQTQAPSLIFTSTNKVYGRLEDLPLYESALRYETMSERWRAISEQRPLDFHSPYGCSKGAAEQYVRDYARSYDLRTIVFRMSCIYGPHQFGNEDQGWVAHFLIRSLEGNPIVLYGDGKQVRDILYVQDLVNALLLGYQNMNALVGSVFNIGGGDRNAISLLELLGLIRQLNGSSPTLRFGAVREGDQRYFVSDTSRFSQRTGWRARVNIKEGIRRLRRWLVDSQVNLEESARITAAT
jgi:CDP-paratose 2-epimerase